MSLHQHSLLTCNLLLKTYFPLLPNPQVVLSTHTCGVTTVPRIVSQHGSSQFWEDSSVQIVIDFVQFLCSHFVYDLIKTLNCIVQLALCHIQCYFNPQFTCLFGSCLQTSSQFFLLISQAKSRFDAWFAQLLNWWDGCDVKYYNFRLSLGQCLTVLRSC